jgi:hypothetical protein
MKKYKINKKEGQEVVTRIRGEMKKLDLQVEGKGRMWIGGVESEEEKDRKHRRDKDI